MDVGLNCIQHQCLEHIRLGNRQRMHCTNLNYTDHLASWEDVIKNVMDHNSISNVLIYNFEEKINPVFEMKILRYYLDNTSYYNNKKSSLLETCLHL